MSGRAHRWAAFPALVVAVGFAPFGVASVRTAGALGRSAVPVLEPRALEPLRPAVLPLPERRVPPGLSDPKTSGEPELVRIVGSEGWDRRRAWIRVGGEVRAFAVGDLLPGGDLVVAIEPGAVKLSRGEVVVALTADAPLRVVEDFPMADPAFTGRRRGPIDPELEAAALETLELVRLGEPRTARIAVDALVAAGELVVPFLVRRTGSLEPLSGVVVELPDGRRIAPRFEGAVAQAVLEVITGQRFGDVLSSEATAEEVLAAADDWASWLGAP